MRRPLSIVMLVVAAFTASQTIAVETDAVRYEHRREHDPDGIGKFYMGREIAKVMGPGGIIWLERPEREQEEQPETVLEALDLNAGDVAVDLGAGTGYYTFRMAPRVGTQGKVFAIDVSPEMLAFVERRAQEQRVTNVHTIRATPDDPRLPENVDVVLLVDVYHELEYPHEVMSRVRERLKPGGRVVLVEYRAEDRSVPIKRLHTMSERQIRRELSAAGLQHVQTIGTLPWQHIVIFERAAE